jgi:hypothetical protein
MPRWQIAPRADSDPPPKPTTAGLGIKLCAARRGGACSDRAKKRALERVVHPTTISDQLPSRGEQRRGVVTRIGDAAPAGNERVFTHRDFGGPVLLAAYLFGAVCPSQSKAAALIMPIGNTLAMNHHLREITSQVAAPGLRRAGLAHAVVILEGAGWHRSQGLVVPGTGGARQYHVVGAAAVQPAAQPGRADLALFAQPLARQLGFRPPGGYHYGKR